MPECILLVFTLEGVGKCGNPGNITLFWMGALLSLVRLIPVLAKFPLVSYYGCWLLTDGRTPAHSSKPKNYCQKSLLLHYGWDIHRMSLIIVTNFIANIHSIVITLLSICMHVQYFRNHWFSSSEGNIFRTSTIFSLTTHTIYVCGNSIKCSSINGSFFYWFRPRNLFRFWYSGLTWPRKATGSRKSLLI